MDVASPFGLPDHSSTVDATEPLRYPHRKLHVILATTGSVASVKAPLIVKELLRILATQSSLNFYDCDALERESDGSTKVWKDEMEWNNRKDVVKDPILHIEVCPRLPSRFNRTHLNQKLRRWADIVIVAPCSANTLAKIAGGLCDNLLTSFLRALDARYTKVVLFPAMNTHMYNHPLTAQQLATVRSLGYEVMGPISKGLACGDYGMGAMTEWKDIVNMVVERFSLHRHSQT